MKRSILRSTLLLVAGSTALCAGARTTSAVAQEGPPPAPVDVVPIVERDVAPRRSFVGTVRPVRSAVVGCESSGRVVELLAREGAPVKKGDALVQLRTERLEIELRAAEALLASRTHELDALVSGTRPEIVRQAEARLAAADADLEFAKWTEESSAKLLAKGSIVEEEHRQARLRLRSAEQAQRVAALALELLQIGPRTETLAAARARVEEQAAMVARIEDDIARRTIRSPFDAHVVHEATENGEWLMAGDPVVELVALDAVRVRVGVIEDFVAHVRPGAAASVTVGALPGRTFTGRVTAVVPRADDRTRAFPVDIEVPNESSDAGPLLKAGMFARVSLDVGAPVRSLIVPKDALVLGGPTPAVYVVVPGAGGAPSTIRAVPVQTGVADGAEIAVTGELAVGDSVVVRGNERLRPGQAVDPRPLQKDGAR